MSYFFSLSLGDHIFFMMNLVSYNILVYRLSRPGQVVPHNPDFGVRSLTLPSYLYIIVIRKIARDSKMNNGLFLLALLTNIFSDSLVWVGGQGIKNHQT